MTSVRFPDLNAVKEAADAAGLKLTPWIVRACKQVADLEAAERAQAAGEFEVVDMGDLGLMRMRPSANSLKSIASPTREFRGMDPRPTSSKRGKK